MREVMFKAEVGDDIFGEDPSINTLEHHAASLFGMESGLYCSSGTQTNQIAINVHTSPGDEVICSKEAHIYNYEGGGIAMNSGASVRLLDGDQGRFTLDSVKENINPDDQHFPVSRLICLEDSCNRGGGSIWDHNEIAKISAYAREHNLGMHLDGARLFNSLVETEVDWKEYGSHFDSISICLSKGLGAPVGSVLLGSAPFIKKARRVRKVFGGGMRQAGIIASAGLYALENNISRLKEDNDHAKEVASVLDKLDWVKSVIPVATNIVIFEVADGNQCQEVIRLLEEKEIKAYAIGEKQIRFVFHLEVNRQDVTRLMETLGGLTLPSTSQA
jgi:threonine aldolase